MFCTFGVHCPKGPATGPQERSMLCDTFACRKRVLHAATMAAQTYPDFSHPVYGNHEDTGDALVNRSPVTVSTNRLWMMVDLR
eukprot:351028-Chlamydomonas_euryale.AAC.2